MFKFTWKPETEQTATPTIAEEYESYYNECTHMHKHGAIAATQIGNGNANDTKY